MVAFLSDIILWRSSFPSKLNTNKISSNSPRNLRFSTQVPNQAVSLVEYLRDIGGGLDACLQHIRSTNPAVKSIYILGRYRFCKPDCFLQLKKQYPEFEFIFDTVHGSKGKETDVVILVDVNNSKYGFPSKIVDDPLLQLVLPDAEPYDYSEERRLFYVAVTRAKHHTYILYNLESPSVFIEEICDEKSN